jgi:signal transduction histidine kinase
VRRGLEGASRRQLGELTAAGNAKDQFLAMLSHELRNPLNAAGNALQPVRHSAASGPTVQHAWDVIDRQVTSLNRLVGDLLDVARISAGRLQIQKTMVDLTGVVRRELEADPIRLEQALGNLLNNASKFTGQDGHIWVTMELTPGPGEEEPGWGLVHVRDDGKGIEAELLPHVFDLFIQADQSLGRTQGGLGIGLTIMQRIVDAHGGQVEARSPGKGQGSEFVMRLPRSRRGPRGETAPETQQPLAPVSETLGRRILIVEDNTDSAETLARLLRISGHDAQGGRTERPAHGGYLRARRRAGGYRPPQHGRI